MPRTKTVRPAKARPVAPAAQNGNGTNGTHATPRSGVSDLAELFAQKTTVLTIYDPRDADKVVKRDTGFRFEVAPIWSPEAQQVVEEYYDQLRKVDGKVDQADPKLAEAVLEQIVRITKRFWQEPDSPAGIILHGELLTPSPENARKLYTTPDLEWLYEDVIEGCRKRDLFFGARPKTA